MPTLPGNVAFTSFNPCSCSNFPILSPVTGVQEVFSGMGTPTVSPTGAQALYIQMDSSPAGQLWQYYSGSWHPPVSGGGGGVQEVFSGNGAPTGVIFPTGSNAIYMQQDSVPPGIIWQYYNGVWH